MRTIKFRAWDEDLRKMIDLEECTVRAINATHSPVMQFTGLLDKNGKEIYEGDVVEYVDSYDGQITSVEKYIVEFSGCSFMLRSTEDSEHDSDMCIAPLTVIGNIYEHPELLTPNE